MADLTRFEQFLNHIAHPEDPIPAPLTRMEQSLLEIAENKDEAALPDYSEASDGDVLSIEDGAPAWKEPSGGGALYVTITALPDPETGELTDTTCDKTYAEIEAALTAGTPVIGKFVTEGIFAPMMPMTSPTINGIMFGAFGYLPLPNSPMLLAATIAIADDDTVTMSNTATVTMTPMGG